MTDWLANAACIGEDTNLFFADDLTNRYAYQHARRVCGRCPVVRSCLDEALRTETAATRQGFRGGLTPKERRRLAVERGQAA